MKKNLLFILCFTFITHTTLAQTTCANGAGKVFEGAIDHKQYCVSNRYMTWLASLAWCDSIGMDLVSLSDCHTIDGQHCPNLKNSYAPIFFYTSSTASATTVYRIVSSNNTISTANRGSGSYVDTNALCKPR